MYSFEHLFSNATNKYLECFGWRAPWPPGHYLIRLVCNQEDGKTSPNFSETLSGDTTWSPEIKISPQLVCSTSSISVIVWQKVFPSVLFWGFPPRSRCSCSVSDSLHKCHTFAHHRVLPESGITKWSYLFQVLIRFGIPKKSTEQK